jgi:hypothetical protein
MLKHAGMLDPQASMIPTFQGSTSTELQWRAWLHRETQNRYIMKSHMPKVYCLLMCNQACI